MIKINNNKEFKKVDVVDEKLVLTDDIETDNRIQKVTEEGEIDGCGYNISSSKCLIKKNYGYIHEINYKITHIESLRDYIGGLVKLNAGTISNVDVKAGCLSGDQVGGVAGMNLGGQIFDVYFEGIISGSHNTGCIVGINDGSISNIEEQSIMKNHNLVAWSTENASVKNITTLGIEEKCELDEIYYSKV